MEFYTTHNVFENGIRKITGQRLHIKNKTLVYEDETGIFYDSLDCFHKRKLAGDRAEQIRKQKIEKRQNKISELKKEIQNLADMRF
jgi:hypothetical protein